MAKHEGKKTDKPLSEKARAPKAKKGFWASLFEPVAQDPDADYLFEEYAEDDDTAETEALLHALLHGEEEGADVGGGDDTVERITWEDDGPVITDIPHDGGYAGEFTAAPDADDADEDAYSILSASFSESETEEAAETDDGMPLEPEEATAVPRGDVPPETPDTIELTAESVVVEEPTDSKFVPPAFLYTTPTPEKVPETPPGYVPLTSVIDETAQMVPEPEPEPAPPMDEPAGFAAPAPEEIADTTMVPYVPPVPEAPAYVPLVSSIDADKQPALYTPPGPAISYVPPVTDISGAPGAAQAEWFDYASGVFAVDARVDGGGQEPIELFDDEDMTDTARRRAQTTRLFRTGTSATTRIHINETDETVRREEALRKAEARAAKRRQDEAAARRSKRKKRGSILRSLFANIAFVLFFIAVVVVALYYGFLLNEVVVMGNEKYSGEYIVKASGLTAGTHMLFCDMDAAAEKIGEDPYLQVESITYIFPNRIRIIVSEREAVAGIAGLDYNVIIDDQGYVLSMSPGTSLSDLLQVSGVSMTGFRLGQRLGEGNDFSTATLIEIIGKLEQYELMDDVVSIDLTTPLAITMKAENGLTIHVGQGTDLDNKMAILAKLLPRFFEQNIGAGTLYLSAKGGAVYSPPYAAGNAQPIVTDDLDINLPQDNPDFIDEDGDGLDDVTGLPAGQTAPLAPGATPGPTPAPTAYVPGGGADDFSG